MWRRRELRQPLVVDLEEKLEGGLPHLGLREPAGHGGQGVGPLVRFLDRPRDLERPRLPRRLHRLRRRRVEELPGIEARGPPPARSPAVLPGPGPQTRGELHAERLAVRGGDDGDAVREGPGEPWKCPLSSYS